MTEAEAGAIYDAGKGRAVRHWLAFWQNPVQDRERLSDARRHTLRALDCCTGDKTLLDPAIDLALAAHAHMLHQGEWWRWEEALRQLLHQIDATMMSERQFALRECLSNICFRQHRLEESIALSGENYRRAKSAGDSARQARSAINLAEAYLNAQLSLPDALAQALYYAEEAGALSAVLGVRWQESDALINAARALAAMNRLAEAEQRLWQGHALASAADLPVYQAKSQLFLGQVAGLGGNWQRGLTHFDTALVLVTSYGDEVGRATVQSNIGRALMELGRWQEAANILEDAVRVFRHHGNAPAEQLALQRLRELEARRQPHQEEILCHRPS